jgi:alpha-methylacyl-CoA racemase
MALNGVKVLEFAGLAPGPFCGMILSDFGADVVRVDRTQAAGLVNDDTLSRGKRSIALDLKQQDAKNIIYKLIEKTDVLIDPFRPGVMEKNGLGPEELCKRNPRLIYARLTGFGQTGPYANIAGHDINYLALSGILSMLGRSNEPPMFPINILADFAAGGLLCAFGIVLALFERTKSGKGQVIDNAMVDGVLYIGSFLYKHKFHGVLTDSRGNNMLDGGSPFYEVYQTKDGKYMSIGSLEPQFYNTAMELLGFNLDDWPQFDSGKWPDLRNELKKKFASKTQAEWTAVFDGSDACVVPVVDIHDLNSHQNTVNRKLLISSESKEEVAPAPAPKLSRTPGTGVIKPQPKIGQHSRDVLIENGFSADQIQKVLANKVMLHTDVAKL